MGATSVKDIGEANNAITETLKALFAVVERYPDLKANENFIRLQEELTNTENKISFARQFYNDMVMQFNAKQQRIPDLIVAKIMGLAQKEYYPVEEEAREVPKVQF